MFDEVFIENIMYFNYKNIMWEFKRCLVSKVFFIKEWGIEFKFLGFM